MKFLIFSFGILLIFWGLAFYPLKNVSNPNHFYGFYLGSAVNFGCLFLNFFAIWWTEKTNSEYVIHAAIFGSLIRFTFVITTLLLVHLLSDLDLTTIALWTLFFYFLCLFYETIFLVKKFYKE